MSEMPNPEGDDEVAQKPDEVPTYTDGADDGDAPDAESEDSSDEQDQGIQDTI